MAKFTNLRVWHEARTLLRLVSGATRDMRAEGDLKSQLRRAAISVVSNISEGSERDSNRDFGRFLIIARASNAEIEAQATMAMDIDSLAPEVAGPILDQCQIVGRMLTKFVAALDTRV